VVEHLSQWAMSIVQNPINLPILGATWVIIEALDPLFLWVVDSPGRTAQARVRLYQLVGIGKRLAAVFWCSLAVWIPLAQPELCVEVAAAGCQTIIERIAVGAVLGFSLTGGHWAAKVVYRKVRGEKRQRRIICVACRKKVLVADLADPCPQCGESPHEVTRR